MPHEAQPSPDGDPLLRALADRVRRLREGRGLTQHELAERSGLSTRFLSKVESGAGNISILRLRDLARALDVETSDLLRTMPGPDRPVVLVGLRGAGKSTVGPLLAERLSVSFVEMDDRIVEHSGLSLDELFEVHGERYYRRIERDTLKRLLAEGGRLVVAAAGGVVNDSMSWQLLMRGATVVWLRATAADHWHRVLSQGDRRPMRDNPAAMDELRGILRVRSPTYAQAHVTVDTSASPPDEVAREIESRLGELERARSEPASPEDAGA